MVIKIETRYYGPTNHKGSRIRVVGNRGAKVYEWEHALPENENHEQAIIKYIKEKWEEGQDYPVLSLCRTDRGVIAVSHGWFIEKDRFN